MNLSRCALLAPPPYKLLRRPADATALWLILILPPRKTMTPHRLIAFATLATSLLAAPTPARAEDADAAGSGEASPAEADSVEQLATARLHFKNGVELISGDEPNYQDAFRQFQLAYAKSSGNWKVLGNLGLCALKLERDGEALAFYRQYLEEGGEDIDPDERAAIEQEVLLIQGNMTSVELSSSQPDVRLSVERQGSSAPPQLYDLEGESVTLGLRAGTLIMQAAVAEKTLTWQSTLSAGETTRHHFDFDKAPEDDASATAGAATAEEPSRSGPSGLRIAGYVTAGVGVAALGGGVAMGLISQSQERDAEELCIGEVCPASARSDFDTADSSALIANILFISGGVLTATGITLAIVGGKKKAAAPQDTARLELGPLLTWGGGGLTAFGRF